MQSSRYSDKNCAELLKAVADNTRLKILHTLYEREKCVTELMTEFNLAQSYISHHLKILKAAGLLVSRRNGQKICYSLKKGDGNSISKIKQESIDLGCCRVQFRK